MSHADEIFSFASDYASSNGYRFGAGARDHLRNRATHGGAEIDRLPIKAQQGKLQEAKDNFASVVDAMIEASKSIPGYEQDHPGEIGERTLGEALKKLCPLWPIC